ncbi:thiol-disulfide isomerase/thioredoxin [Arcicella aurantiaca]|uniref:Thiol-disulfide isomerase/thioredoxin n=1 Tax=Arcicella aurantiaca TaxID=591202 RepID=A0A316DJY2_9BACT|nr:TlpA disulfide reductase family protein [Arcicella aurantiaca]PWK18431.1 thiol-disulfide isomerase/thioredoxin [Arcicella aurantiaca]
MKKHFILLTVTSALLFTKCSSKRQETTDSSDSLTAVSTAKTTPTSLFDPNNKVVDFKDITTKHKVTYVDFWASWCGPCRGEMPASQALREAYKDKDVNFLYVSLDEESAAWAEANKSFALPDGHSFLLANPSESIIPATFNISSIPRYILIDENGKVINEDAPRPSENERITEALDKILK